MSFVTKDCPSRGGGGGVWGGGGGGVEPGQPSGGGKEHVLDLERTRKCDDHAGV